MRKNEIIDVLPCGCVMGNDGGERTILVSGCSELVNR